MTSAKPRRGQDKKITRRLKTSRWVEIEGKENVQKKVLDLLRSFCSYMKHGERAKLNRRAIASANPLLKMFPHLIEEVHLKFG